MIVLVTMVTFMEYFPNKYNQFVTDPLLKNVINIVRPTED